MIENRKEEEDKGRNEMRLDIFFLSPPSCFLFLFSLSPRFVQYSPYYEYLYRHKYNIIERGRAKFCAFTSLCNDSKITNCDIIFLIFFIQKFVFIVNNFCILLIFFKFFCEKFTKFRFRVFHVSIRICILYIFHSKL